MNHFYNLLINRRDPPIRMFSKTILLIIALTSSKAISLRAGITAKPPTPPPQDYSTQVFDNPKGPANLA
jgi:hypothetical protein